MNRTLAIIIIAIALLAACSSADAVGGENDATPEPASYFDGQITVALVAPFEVSQGERLEGLNVIITNHSDEPFDFSYSGNVMDFEARDAEGNLVWRYLGFWAMPLPAHSLAPGQSMLLSELGHDDGGLRMQPGHWDLRDTEGQAVEPGEYSLKGIVRLYQEPPPEGDAHVLETAAHEVTVHDTENADTPEPASYFDGQITVELIAPSQARQGAPVQGLDMVITNHGDEPFEFVFTEASLSFMVLDAEGNEIWRPQQAFRGMVMPAERAIDPGGSWTVGEHAIARPGTWDLRDSDGFPVTPGEYQIKGVMELYLEGEVSHMGPPPKVLETAAHDLTVQEAPLPAYAQDVELTLTAPAEAQRGEPIPMDLRITNTGDTPVTVWWSGGGRVPALNYSNVIIEKDGEPVWLGMYTHGLRGSGERVLEPGESRTLGSYFGGYGIPWEWDQRGDCGQHRFEPCEGPVKPGTYTVRGFINVSEPGSDQRTPIGIGPQALVIMD